MTEARWYCVHTKYGFAEWCENKDEAEIRAAECNVELSTDIFRAVQLVDAAELEKAQKRIAELTDLLNNAAAVIQEFIDRDEKRR